MRSTIVNEDPSGRFPLKQGSAGKGWPCWGLRLGTACPLSLQARWLWALWFASLVMAPGFVTGQDRETKVRSDQRRILQEGFWIYNDLPRGLAQAQASNKPVLVVFRCIPCEACAQLDESVIDNNPQVRKWLTRFVPVRIVHANNMDLHKFQFDYDQSWAAFILHADGTIIGRYGTRSHETQSDQDVTLEGFLDSLSVALELHQQFDQVRPQLLAKTGAPAPVDRPELLPKLKEKYGSALDYEGRVVASCIHCHQVGEALFEWQRSQALSQDRPLAPEAVFPYPNPKVLGIVMDPKQARTVASVTAQSPAAQAGLRAGDQITRCQSQPIISTADIQWVLHHLGDHQQLDLEVQRGQELIHTRLKLPDAWREADDIAWRAGSWQLRRLLTGGLKLEPLSPEARQQLNLHENAIGLKVKHVGQFAPHDRAKRAGFKVGDILLTVGPWQEPLTESQLLVKLLREERNSPSWTVQLQRGEKRMTLELPPPNGLQ